MEPLPGVGTAHILRTIGGVIDEEVASLVADDHVAVRPGPVVPGDHRTTVVEFSPDEAVVGSRVLAHVADGAAERRGG